MTSPKINEPDDWRRHRKNSGHRQCRWQGRQLLNEPGGQSNRSARGRFLQADRCGWGTLVAHRSSIRLCRAKILCGEGKLRSSQLSGARARSSQYSLEPRPPLAQRRRRKCGRAGAWHHPFAGNSERASRSMWLTRIAAVWKKWSRESNSRRSRRVEHLASWHLANGIVFGVTPR